jgi:hypothetical protein
MSQAVRKLTPGAVVIGFVRPNGDLIGELVDASIGHDAHSYAIPGLPSLLASGHAIAITIGKTASGAIKVFGSGAFSHPSGGSLTTTLRDAATRLVE